MPPVEITNHSRRTLDFVIAGKPKDGVPPTGHVDPGETKTLDLADADSPQLRARVHTGLISIKHPRQAKA